MRTFGTAAYQHMLNLPFRAVQRFAVIQGQRDAARQLEHLRLTALADGMDLGREYVRGKDDPKPKKTDGHYSLKHFRDVEDTLERQAEPWIAAERQRQRRIAEQDAKFKKLRESMGVSIQA